MSERVTLEELKLLFGPDIKYEPSRDGIRELAKHNHIVNAALLMHEVKGAIDREQALMVMVVQLVQVNENLQETVAQLMAESTKPVWSITSE